MTAGLEFRAVCCATAILLTAACASSSLESGSANAKNARTALKALKSDQALVGLAPAAMQEAETAVQRAEGSQSSDPSERDHLGYLAEVKVEIARAAAEKAQAEIRARTLAVERERQERAAAQAAEERARREAGERAAKQAALHNDAEALGFERTDRGYVLTLDGGALFGLAQWDIEPDAAQGLERLVDFLARQESAILVEGHADAQGDDEYNLTLSQRRADAVATYLVSRGVAADRITAIGKGEALPVADNGTAAGRAQNRRVEIVIGG